jgi:hypothetical protein
LQRGSQRPGEVRHRPVEHRCGWHPIGPGRARRINRSEIPEVAGSFTAVRCGLRRPRILFHLCGQQMIGIPELPRPYVGNPSQDGGERRRQIGREDGLPDRKDANPGRRPAGQHVLDCGGPPQAVGSSGREQDDDTDFVGGAVEFTAQRVEADQVQRRERGLARRCVPLPPQIPSEGTEKGGEERD